MQQDRTDSLTDVAYWDRTWADRDVPTPLDPHGDGLNFVVPRALHAFFSDVFQKAGLHPGDRILEAGCGGSVFVPYFAREFRLVSDGIDNSPTGCALSEAIARRSGIESRIACADVFAPPTEMLGAYDAVCSLGLVEHFVPTEQIIAALARYLRPRAILVTLVPNLRGLPGALQRRIDPAVYDVHVPLSPEALARAHSECGLEVLDARYLMSINLSALNFSGPKSRVPARIGLRCASWISKGIWALEKVGPSIRPNAMTSPLLGVVARAK
jgi:SAM-dependent methyltransferase